MPIRLSSALLMLILGSLQTVTPISIDMYLPALPTIARDLHVSPGAAQFTMAMFLIGVAIGQIAYGPITDKYGRKKPLLVGLGIYVLGAVIAAVLLSLLLVVVASGYASTHSLTVLFFVLSAAIGFIIPNNAALAFSTVRERMGSAAALQGTMQSVFGGVAGGLVGTLANGATLPVIGIIMGFAVLAAVFLIAAHRRQPVEGRMLTPLLDQEGN